MPPPQPLAPHPSPQAATLQADVDRTTDTLASARSSELAGVAAAEAAVTRAAVSAWEERGAAAGVAQTERAAAEAALRANTLLQALCVAEDVLRVGHFLVGTGVPTLAKAAEFIAAHGTAEAAMALAARAGAWISERARSETMRMLPPELREVTDAVARAAINGAVPPELAARAAAAAAAHFFVPVRCGWGKGRGGSQDAFNCQG